MIKILISLLLFGNIIFASASYELKLYEKILPIVLKSSKIAVYADSNSFEILRDSNLFTLTNDCTKASILIGKTFNTLQKSCLEKPIFATGYRAFRDFNSSFGVFYWRKGRPQLRFSLNRVKKLGLFLPQSLLKYTVE